MKLDRTSEEIISFLRTQDMYAYDYSTEYPRYFIDRGIGEDEFMACCRALKRKGACEDALDRPGGKVCGICLTHEMIHREEFRFINFKDFMFHSVLVPVAVSVLTSGAIAACAICWALLT